MFCLVWVTNATTVDLPWFWEYQDWLATYAYNECEAIKDWSDSGTYYRRWVAHRADYTCKWFILTMNAENGGWNMSAKPTNTNWSTDNWLCQLNSTYHSKFIRSEDFNDPYKQIDYCLEVWQNAAQRNKMPRYAHEVRHLRDGGILFNKLYNPALDEWIKVDDWYKKECTRVANVRADQYVQVDSRLWILLNIFRPKQKSKIFICDNI